MRRIIFSLIGMVLVTGLPAEISPPSTVAGFNPEQLDEIDVSMRQSIETGRLPGAVVWIEHGGVAYHLAMGWKSLVPEVLPMSEDTIFDVASLTKVVATTPSVMKLVEEGKIDLEGPVARYVPEFTGDGREIVPVKWLMTHNSGLPPGIKFDAAAPWSGYDEGIRRACAEPLAYTPGTQFVYSDINFIMLGEIVRRVSGMRVDAFVRENIFGPLKMTDSGYLPPKAKRDRIAPTTVEAGEVVRGVVHDPTSRRMGGVCGHAGLFTTVGDLARYCRMMLNRGTLDGVRVLEAETVDRMTRVQSPVKVDDLRGLGWDVQSKFTHQRGDFFPDGGYGHTGWTGPSLWLDPASRTFVVFMTNRNHPSEAGSTGTLRYRIGSLAAEAVADWRTLALPGFTLPVPRSEWPRAEIEIGLPVVMPVVLNGIDVLERDGYKPLQGMRIGLITNQTGIDRQRRTTIDLLAGASSAGVDLTCLFSPEHGIRGALDQTKISDTKDEKTGLPVFSLYGSNRAPTAAQLRGIDALVFDIQDIGCRFYTYMSTMSLSLQAAAAAGKKFIVLDRVDPINGIAIGGPLREGADSFTAAHRIPVRHGMTVGEMAKLIAVERKLKVDLQVVRCEGWNRATYFDASNLPWVNPSPNMRSLAAAVLYPGVGLLEFTNLSVGRGTDTPFEWVGAPWIDQAGLVRDLSAAGLSGIRFEPVQFTPTSSIYEGKLCHGVRLVVTNRTSFEPVTCGAAIAAALVRLHPKELKTDNLNKLLCHEKSTAAIKAGAPISEIRQLWQADEREFILRRRKFLLY